MTILYFAYGSNMLPARLRARCASARVIGRAAAANFDLEFSKASKDGSGKATLIKSESATTPGVLFEIAATELSELDRAEGAGFGYDRVDDFSVAIGGTSERVAATTYFANAVNRQLKPYDWYLALVIAGARHHLLGGEHTAKLRLIEHLKDEDRSRQSRQDALHALQAHGFRNYEVLLKPPE